MVLLNYLFCAVAWGHAFPKVQNPGAGDTVSGNIKHVNIEFNSQIEPVFSTLRVMNSQGAQVSKGKGEVDKGQSNLKTELPALPPGNYKVMWSVVAHDGHRTQGNYTFTVR